MKLRLRRQDLISAIKFYNETLHIYHGSLALTPAKQELILREFEILKIKKQKQERTNIWFAPFFIKFDNNGRYTVTIDEFDKRILIMDW